jgi:hypothetical protein
MDFSPFNNIVKRCLQGMEMEAKDNAEEASKLFRQGWEEATNDFEKFLSAYYVARHQPIVSDRLTWLTIALEYALKTDNEATKSTLPTLYAHIATCYEDLGDAENTKKNRDLGTFLYGKTPSDKGPFYHGTKANLQVGDFLMPGGISNYQSELIMNHIYFTAIVNGAGLAATLAKGDGAERVYIIEPTGSFENDPNLTDKKFPGNLTRSYRSQTPLKIVGEVTEWGKQTPQEIQTFRKKLDTNNGAIIN